MFKKSYGFLLEKMTYLFLFVYKVIFLLAFRVYLLYSDACKKTGKDVPKIPYVICGIISVPLWWLILIAAGLLIKIPISTTIAGIFICLDVPIVVIMSVFVFEEIEITGTKITKAIGTKK